LTVQPRLPSTPFMRPTRFYGRCYFGPNLGKLNHFPFLKISRTLPDSLVPMEAVLWEFHCIKLRAWKGRAEVFGASFVNDESKSYRDTF